ncbi:MAG TPA: LamG-like jellyroll fold domain-containing protein, partial [Gemmatimonadales bacterium]
HYVVGVADASGTLLRIYVDGTQRNTAAYTGTSQTGAGELHIGNSPDIILQTFNGGIDEVRVAAAARSADWISAEFNNQTSPASFYQVLDEELQADVELDLTGNSLTLEAWVQFPANPSGNDGILSKNGFADGYRMVMQGAPPFVSFELTSSAGDLDTTGTLAAGPWHHVVATYDGSTMRVYLDGVQDPTTRAKSGNIDRAGKELWLGHGDHAIEKAWSFPWQGQLDEIRISNNARSAAWIGTQFNNQSSPGTFHTVGAEQPWSCVTPTPTATPTNTPTPTATNTPTPAATDTPTPTATPSGPGWWDCNYQYRQQLTVTAGSAAVPSGYSVQVSFNHAALVSGGKSLASGNDIRVVFWNGLSWVELDRMLEPGSAWNNASTRLWLKTQAALGASASDTNYYIYYGNSGAGAPPANGNNVWTRYDGFETGNLTGWNGNSVGNPGDLIEASLDQAYTGTYSGKGQSDTVDPSQGMVWWNVAAQPTYFARIQIYLPASFSLPLPPPTRHVTVMQFIDTGPGWDNVLSTSIAHDRTVYMWNDLAGEAYGYQLTTPVSLGAWHTLEMQATMSTGPATNDGSARLWLDGNLEIQATGINMYRDNVFPTVDADNIDRFATVFYWGNPGTQVNTVYVDDVQLRDYVNPEPTTGLAAEQPSTCGPTATPTPTSTPGGMGWWDANYAHRAQITVLAGSSAIAANYPTRFSFDHAGLVGLGKSLANGNDARIVYWNGATWTELARALFDDGPAGQASSTWNAASTTLFFKTVAGIPASGSDTGYYLYYGYPLGGSPPTNTPSSRYFMAESLGETTTTSSAYATKLQLQFTPSAASEQWVVVATWRQREIGSLGTTVSGGYGRISLNGSPRTGTNDITFRQSGDLWKTFQAFLKVTGTTAQQTISIDHAWNGGGTDAIDNARIVAFLIPDPANANIQYSEALAVTNDIANPTDSLTTTFSPTSAGDYVWMVNGFVHEGPGGGSNGGLFAIDEGGATQQNSAESYTGVGSGFVPFIHFERHTLTTGSQTFTIRHQPDAPTGGEREGLTQLLFRADVFEAVEAASSTVMDSTTSTSPVTKNTHSTTASAARDYIYLVVMGLDHNVQNVTLSTFGDIRLGGTTMLADEVAIDRAAYDYQTGWAYAENVTGGRIVDTRFWAESGQTAQASWSHILALRYKEPGTSLGPEE